MVISNTIRLFKKFVFMTRPPFIDTNGEDCRIAETCLLSGFSDHIIPGKWPRFKAIENRRAEALNWTGCWKIGAGILYPLHGGQTAGGGPLPFNCCTLKIGTVFGNVSRLFDGTLPWDCQFPWDLAWDSRDGPLHRNRG